MAHKRSNGALVHSALSTGKSRVPPLNRACRIVVGLWRGHARCARLAAKIHIGNKRGIGVQVATSCDRCRAVPANARPDCTLSVSFSAASQCYIDAANRCGRSIVWSVCLYHDCVLFLSLPRSEGWPHHGRTFSIYFYPLSF